MSTESIEKLEKYFPEIVSMMLNEFNSHEFFLKLAQNHQEEYIEALFEYKNNGQPFQTVHALVAKRLKQCDHLVFQIDSKLSQNIFGEESEAAVWRKVK